MSATPPELPLSLPHSTPIAHTDNHVSFSAPNPHIQALTPSPNKLMALKGPSPSHIYWCNPSIDITVPLSQGLSSVPLFFNFHNDVFKVQSLGLHPFPPSSVTDDELAVMRCVFESCTVCHAASVHEPASLLHGNLAFT